MPTVNNFVLRSFGTKAFIIDSAKTNHAPWYYLTLLILAGEAVFILPFVIPRIFRPTVLDVFGVDNTQLGLCFSIYGIVAMISYLFGGPLADRYQPRKLIAVALWMTALGGVFYAQFPSFRMHQILYGYWGFTTIFLFWAAMIKATRVWGGTNSQGRAFSFLDGGRGLVGVLFGLLGVFIFSIYMAEDLGEITLEIKKRTFSYLIYASSIIIAFFGILVWVFMKSGKDAKNVQFERISKEEIKQVLLLPSVWILMLIILCAYVGYKITDVISQYAEEVMLYDQVGSAKVGTILQFLRPTTGIVLGLIADRFRITVLLILGFVLTLIGGLLFATGIISPDTTFLFFMSVLTTGVGVYACRSLYFGVMQLGKIPLALTGTAVGLISLVGYTPEIFAGPTYGYLLDQNSGELGHQHVFWMLSGFAFVGSIAAWVYLRLYGKSSL